MSVVTCNHKYLWRQKGVTILTSLEVQIFAVILTLILHPTIVIPGIIKVTVVKMIAYHKELNVSKFGTHAPVFVLNLKGATFANGGMHNSTITIQPLTSPMIT